jgi:hypothetical protein
MLSKHQRPCSHFKPMSTLPYSCKSSDCTHCEYYSKNGCHKSYYDAIEEADGEI